MKLSVHSMQYNLFSSVEVAKSYFINLKILRIKKKVKHLDKMFADESIIFLVKRTYFDYLH